MDSSVPQALNPFEVRWDVSSKITSNDLSADNLIRSPSVVMKHTNGKHLIGKSISYPFIRVIHFSSFWEIQQKGFTKVLWNASQ